MNELSLATSVFVACYAVIVSERIDRTVVAMLGGILMIVFGILSEHQAIEAVDFNTLALLIGMMIIVVVLKRTGVFRYTGWRMAVLTGGDPMLLMLGFAAFTAIASAFLDNVTTILLTTPVTIAICADLSLNPRPFIVTQVFASNIGGTATLIGDPPNLLIGGATGLSFVAFLVHLGPVVALVLALYFIAAWLFYRPRLGIARVEARRAILAADARAHISDGQSLRRSLVVLALTIVGFLAHSALHLHAGVIAMLGATVLLLLSRADLHGVLAEIEWPTIFFFIGLFVLVGGVEQVGLLDRAALGATALTSGDPLWTALVLLWFTGIASAIVDNIPAVATLIPLTIAMGRVLFPELRDLDAAAVAASAQVQPLWWALALGACLGGNGSLIGASANVVAAGIAERNGSPVGFWGFTRIGAPVAFCSLALSSVYIWLRYFAF